MTCGRSRRRERSYIGQPAPGQDASEEEPLLKRLKPLLGLLIGGGLLAAMACGGGDDPTATSSAPTATSAPGATATTAAPTPTQASGGGDTISAPNPSTPSGTAVLAFPRGDFSDENGRAAAQASDSLKNWGVAETLFQRSRDDEPLPWLATGWEIASDLSSATVFIQEGVPFQPHLIQ